jgi:hypothetical protein
MVKKAISDEKEWLKWTWRSGFATMTTGTMSLKHNPYLATEVFIKNVLKIHRRPR